MSYKVSSAFIEQSRSKHGTRTVGLILAETSHHDGVAWMRQQPSKSVRKRKGPDTDNIAFRTKLSPKQVQRCIDRLQELDELEIVWGRDHGNRFHICRLIVGPVRFVDVDYERGLPFLEGRFWTPEELELPLADRPSDGHALASSQLKAGRTITGGQNVPQPDEATWATFAPDLGDICDQTEETFATPPYNSPLDLVPNSPFDFNTQTPSVEVSADAAEEPESTSVKELVRAFAEVVGAWPDGHAGWSAWCAALAPLAAAGVTPDELSTRTRAYLERWPLDTTPDSPAFMFALTKHWQRINASLERSYFGLFRWATGNSWRLGDLDHARWVIDASDRITTDERTTLVAIVEQAYRAHSDEKSGFLQWVESTGWTLEDADWRQELKARTSAPSLATLAPEMRRQGTDRRLEIRQAFAELDLGLRKDAA